MAFLRIIQKMSNIAYGYNETRKLLKKLNTMTMTKTELVEFLEREISANEATIKTISKETNDFIFSGKPSPREQIDLQWSLVHLKNQYELLQLTLRAHIKGFNIASKPLQD